MLVLLKAIFVIFLEILIGMRVPFSFAVGGSVAVVVLLRLATFSSREVVRMVTIWCMIGSVCSLVYSFLPFFTGSESLLALFAISLITGPLLTQMFPRTPANKWFRPWVPYVVWVYYWSAALLGWRYGWMGLLVITLPALLVAVGGLFFVSGFILSYPTLDVCRGERLAPASGSLPTFKQEIQDFYALMRYPENAQARKKWFQQRSNSLRCLLTYALGTNYPYYVVIDEKIAERTEGNCTWLPWQDKVVKRLDGDVFGNFLAGPGIILTGCDQAVVLSTGLKFKGARGPGVILTQMSESPSQVIDLRVQLCVFPVEAWTKDGIAIRVDVSIPFRIGTGKERLELGKRFPYRSSDAFKAIVAQMIKHTDLSDTPENLEWYDLPKLAGERIIHEIISRYEFDELYPPFELQTELGWDLRSRITRELQDRLDRKLSEWGMQCVGSSIGNLMPVDMRVVKKRVDDWRTGWTRKAMFQQTVVESRHLHLSKMTHAQAQVDIILAIGERIEQRQAIGAPISMAVVAYHFVEILEELTSRSALYQLLPGDTGNIIQRARSAIGKPTNIEEVNDA